MEKAVQLLRRETVGAEEVFQQCDIDLVDQGLRCLSGASLDDEKKSVSFKQQQLMRGKTVDLPLAIHLHPFNMCGRGCLIVIHYQRQIEIEHLKCLQARKRDVAIHDARFCSSKR